MTDPVDDSPAPSPLRGAAYLLVASSLWGAAFIPQAISVEHMGPLWGTAIRFCIAAPFAVLLALPWFRSGAAPLRSVIVLGTLLYVAFYLQTAAIKITPVWRVSLLTGTYAAFTPLLAPLFGHARPTRWHWSGVGLALIGLVLLTGAGTSPAVPLNLGDLMTLGHALLTAVHLLLIGRLVAAARPRVLNAQQLIVMALCSVPVALLVEEAPPLAVLDNRTLFAFGYLAVFSSTVAFGAQIAGQKTASPPAAALIMLLEAPIGATLAVMLLDEPVTALQAVGGGLLMVGVAMSVAGDVRRQRRAA